MRSAWLAASLAAFSGLAVRRSRAATMEAVARACHELRGPLTAVRLGLELDVRTAERSEARDRAIDLELARAALALDDLGGSGRCLGRQPVDREFDAGLLVADAVEASRPGAQARGVELALRPDLGRAWIR